jgi:hypothetical protein
MNPFPRRPPCQALIRLAQQQRSRVTRQPVLAAAHLHRAIERGLKQRLLAFTHPTTPFHLPKCRENPGYCRLLRTTGVESFMGTVNNAG